MVDEKVSCIVKINVEYLIGVDCGCFMNIGGRIEWKG